MSAATFSVKEVFNLTGRTVTCVLGRITAGEIRAGMRVSLPLPDGVFLSARLHGIGAVYGRSRVDDVSLLLEIPEEDARERWKALCQNGASLSIDDDKKG